MAKPLSPRFVTVTNDGFVHYKALIQEVAPKHTAACSSIDKAISPELESQVEDRNRDGILPMAGKPRSASRRVHTESVFFATQKQLSIKKLQPTFNHVSQLSMRCHAGRFGHVCEKFDHQRYTVDTSARRQCVLEGACCLQNRR